MNAASFKESLLSCMEAKVHWAWPLFTSGQVAKDKLHIHFEQEYEVYVRDFPILIGWAYVQCPVAEVRRELAENLFEEETGGLVPASLIPNYFCVTPKASVSIWLVSKTLTCYRPLKLTVNFWTTLVRTKVGKWPRPSQPCLLRERLMNEVSWMMMPLKDRPLP